jgi:hypothetical protein
LTAAQTPSALRKTIVSLSLPSAALTTKPSVTRSWLRGWRRGENLPAWILGGALQRAQSFSIR